MSPTTRTLPFERSVAVCDLRALTIDPVLDQVPVGGFELPPDDPPPDDPPPPQAMAKATRHARAIGGRDLRKRFILFKYAWLYEAFQL